jgi:hypothetical protein
MVIHALPALIAAIILDRALDAVRTGQRQKQLLIKRLLDGDAFRSWPLTLKGDPFKFLTPFPVCKAAQSAKTISSGVSNPVEERQKKV